MPTGVGRRAFGVLLIALLCMGVPTTAQADNLILNPGFENWDGTSFGTWLESGSWAQTTIAHSGSYAVVLGPAQGEVKSTIFTNPALGTYEFGVWLRLYYESPLQWDAAVMDVYVTPWANQEYLLYQSFDGYRGPWTPQNGGFISPWFLLSGTFQLSSPVPALELVIALHNNTAAYTLAYADDAYLSPVPEPATLALLGLGLIGVGVTLRRRRV